MDGMIVAYLAALLTCVAIVRVGDWRLNLESEGFRFNEETGIWTVERGDLCSN